MSVSVVITCHNEERFIDEAIRSVAAQTAYDRIEQILVVNDGSEDDSQKVLEAIAAGNGKLEILQAGRIGVSAARNLAIGKARGEFIAFLDGDDYWVQDKIAQQLAAFRLSPEIGLVYSDFYDFSDPQARDAQLIHARPYRWNDENLLATYFVNDAPIIPSTVMLRRAALSTAGLFDPEMRLCEDTDMFLRVAEKWRFEHVPGGLTYKRRHDSNATLRLEALVPVTESLTAKFIARNPELGRLASKRLARRYSAIANDCAKHDERTKALSYLWRSFRYDPFYWRLFVYFPLAILPKQVGVKLRNLARRIL